MRATTYLGVLAILLLLLSLSLPFANAAEQNELRATQAKLLIELAQAEGDNYAIDCGNAEVLNTAEPLRALNGYEPVVCVLDMGSKQAVTFTTTDRTNLATVIEHFLGYGDPAVNNQNIIKETHINTDACDNPTPVGDFGRCDGAIDGMRDYDINLYYQVNPTSSVTIYLVTIGFRPSIDEGWWQGILNFFKTLLGIGDDTAPGGEDIQAFERAYFAHTKNQGNERDVRAFFNADDADDMDSSGRASIIYKGFALDFSTFAGDATYMPGHDHTQVLMYEHIMPDVWHKITAALRLKATNAPPLASDTCGNNILGYGEDCEDDGQGGFLGQAQTCQDLGANYGTLKCAADCTYDTSDCLSCADADGDDYFTAEGVPAELKTLNRMLVGSHAADTIYDDTVTGHGDDYALRETLNIGAQSFPLPLNHFKDITNFETTLTTTRDALLDDYEDCLIENTTTYCLGEALTSNTGSNTIDVLGGLVTQQMLAPNNIIDEGQCAWGQAWNCPNGLVPSSFGYAATSYKEFLITMAEEGIEPIFFLDNNPYRLADTSEHVLESALTCAALARGVKNTWENAEVAAGSHYADVEANTYVYGYRHGIVDDDNLLDAYQACRLGVHAAQNARLYYYPKTLVGIGTVVTHPQYAQLADIALNEPERARGLIDGIVTDNPDPYAVPSKRIKTLDAKYITFVDLRKTIGAQVLVITNNTDSLTTGYKFVGSQRANARYLLFMGIKNAVSGVPLGTETSPTTEGTFLLELEDTLADRGLSAPSDTTLPQTHMLIAHGTDTKALIAFTQAGVSNILSLDACTAATIEKENNGHFESIAEYDGSIGVYRYTMSDWACFLKNTVLTSCSSDAKPFDCNDEDPAINPEAIEDCDDGIDNDCDGLIDTADTCEYEPLPPATGCDFNGICVPDKENVYTCSDCYGYMPCPQPVDSWGDLGMIGHYNLSMRWDTDGVPKLRIAPEGSCKIGFVSPSTSPREFPYKIDALSDTKTESIYLDSTGPTAYVSLKHLHDPDGFNGWKIYYNGGGDTTASGCWGVSNPNFKGFIGEQINLFEYGYCSLNRCLTFVDCDDGALCLAISNEYDYRTCVNDGFPGGGRCFIPGTPVLMNDSSEKNIEELTAGMQVVGYDELRGVQRAQTIVDVLIHDADQELLVINGRITVTPEHRFFTQRGWFTAGELVLGDALLTNSGEKEIVTSIETTPYTGKVYNIHTEPDHDYYAAGVLVHNMKPGEDPIYELP